MANVNSIYYPWIEVRDTGWLRTACLYWDTIHTIVPASMGAPYSDKISRELEDEGVLRPYFVSPDLDVIDELEDDFLTYLETDEVKTMLLGGRSKMSFIHPQKLPRGLDRLSRIHPEKLSYELRHLFRESLIPHRNREGWLEMPEALADYYMTLLATRVSNELGASVVTDESRADGVNLIVKAGAKIPNPITMSRDARRYRKDFRPNISAPVELVEGALATLALDVIRIDPSTSTRKLVEFRKRYASELGRFRSAIGELASKVDEDLPLETMRQKVWDIYTNELQPSLAELKAALDGRQVKWAGNALLKASFLSAGPTSLLVALGLAVPQALLAGVGISLVGSAVLYSADKKEEIRTNPYSYLLRAEKNLA